ncbi:hypothetical protein ACFXTH_011217 [Malus domestica]
MHRSYGEAGCPMITGIKIMLYELLARCNLANQLLLGSLVPVHPIVYVKDRVSDLHQGSGRHIGKVIFVKQESCDFSESSLPNSHRALQTWLPKSFTDKTFWVIRRKRFFISWLHY